MLLWGIWKRVAAVSGFLSGCGCGCCSFVLAIPISTQIAPGATPLAPYFNFCRGRARVSKTNNAAAISNIGNINNGDDDSSNMAHNKQ